MKYQKNPLNQAERNPTEESDSRGTYRRSVGFSNRKGSTSRILQNC